MATCDFPTGGGGGQDPPEPPSRSIHTKHVFGVFKINASIMNAFILFSFFLASGDICRLLVTFSNSFGPRS